MTDTDTDTITLGVQAGDPTADAKTKPHYIELRKLLAATCVGPYSPEVDEFAIVLRIDGEFFDFDFEGLEKLRRRKKDRYITVDIGVPERRWKEVTAADLRRYLADQVGDALQAFVERLKKDKVAIEDAALRADYQRVRDQYLG